MLERFPYSLLENIGKCSHERRFESSASYSVCSMLDAPIARHQCYLEIWESAEDRYGMSLYNRMQRLYNLNG